jgi:hypothetical protein
MCCAESSTICPRRQVTTDPVPRRTMRSSRLPSSLLIARTCTAWAISHLLREVRIRRDDGDSLNAQPGPHRPRNGRRLAAAAAARQDDVGRVSDRRPVAPLVVDAVVVVPGGHQHLGGDVEADPDELEQLRLADALGQCSIAR